MARTAVEHAGLAEGRRAVDLGCGLGIETQYLAAHGWHVHAFDADPTVTPRLAALASDGAVVHTEARLQELTQLPDCHLLLACASLPFVPRSEFDRLWTMIREALQPGGILAVDLFGAYDDWASSEGTFLTRREADGYMDGLDVLIFDEEQHDGRAFSGPKHWHSFTVVARMPLATS